MRADRVSACMHTRFAKLLKPSAPARYTVLIGRSSLV